MLAPRPPSGCTSPPGTATAPPPATSSPPSSRPAPSAPACRPSPPPPNLFVGPSGSYWIVVTSNDIKNITLRRNGSVASHVGSGSRSGWSFHGRSSRSLTAASWSSASIGSGDTHQHIRAEIRGRLPLWGATLTAGVASVAFTGFASGYGSLSDTDFTYEGTDYTIGALHRSITVFRINLNRTLTAAARNDLTLWLGGTAYPLSSATEESLLRAEARRCREVIEGPAETVKNPSRRDQ